MCDWQVYGDVPDESASVAVAGYRPTKTVEMELHFDRVFGDWMLYDAVNMKGEAAHLIMFSAYGRKPRRYDFPDDLPRTGDADQHNDANMWSPSQITDKFCVPHAFLRSFCP